MNSKPSPDEISWLMRQGLTLEQAASRLGVHRQTLHSWCRSLGLKWPHSNYAKVDYFGEKVSLREGARRAELREKTVYDRYYRGERGRDLWRPSSRSHSRRPKSQYELDMDGTEWQLVLDCYRAQAELLGDKDRAKRLTARKFSIPTGAIGAAERGELQRLG